MVHILIHTVNCRNKIDRSFSNLSPKLSTNLLSLSSYFDNFLVSLYHTVVYVFNAIRSVKIQLIFIFSTLPAIVFLQIHSLTTPKYTRFTESKYETLQREVDGCYACPILKKIKANNKFPLPPPPKKRKKKNQSKQPFTSIGLGITCMLRL